MQYFHVRWFIIGSSLSIKEKMVGIDGQIKKCYIYIYTQQYMNSGCILYIL